MGKNQAPGKPVIVKMVRPEDQQPKPCVAEVTEDRIDEFTAAGWVVKTTPDEPEEVKQDPAGAVDTAQA